MIPQPKTDARQAEEDALGFTVLRESCALLGYTLESNADGTEHRLIRPDGTVAMIARKKKSE